MLQRWIFEQIISLSFLFWNPFIRLSRNGSGRGVLLRLENLSQFIQVRGLSIRHQFVNEKETLEYLWMPFIYKNKQAMCAKITMKDENYKRNMIDNVISGKVFH